MKNYLLVGLLTATSALYSQKNEVSFSAQVENRTSDSVMIQNQSGFKKIIVANKNGVFTDQFKVEDGIYYFSIGLNQANEGAKLATSPMTIKLGD